MKETGNDGWTRELYTDGRWASGETLPMLRTYAVAIGS